MPLDRPQLSYRLTSPLTALVVGLAAALGLMFLSPRWVVRAKTTAAAALRPAQLVVGNVREHGKEAVASARRHWDTAEQLHEAETRFQTLEEENRRLAAELEIERGRRLTSAEDPGADQAERLLKTEAVCARVLGRQARAFLQRQHLLDVGANAGIQPDAMVVEDSPPLVDRGRDAGLAAGQLVLSSGRVWGKVVEVGDATSVVRTITEPGYRDVVRLASPAAAGGPLRWGPQGVLEGSGEPLARICRVEATEPVAIGDLVYTATGQGLLPQPLLYGRVVRLARPVGASHWEIWMEPAVRPGVPEHVAVLRTELNPARVAKDRKSAEQAPMHLILLVPILYAVAVVQTSLVDLIQVGRVAPDLFALTAVVWVLTVPGSRSFLVAGLIGLVEDLVSPGGLGLGMAGFLLVGYAVATLRAKFPLNHAALRVLAVAGAVTVLTLMLAIGHWLFGEAAFTLKTLLERAAGVGIYTAAVSLPVWMVLGWCRGSKGSGDGD